jgi:hypothetical protein
MAKIKQENYTPDMYRKDVELINAVEGTFPIDFSNPNRHLEDKIEIIRWILGHNMLRVGSDRHEVKFLPLENCKPERVTLMLRDAYRAAKKRFERYGNPENRERQAEKSGLIRQARDYLEAERELEGNFLEDAKASTANVLADLSEGELFELSKKYREEVMGGFYRS